eukprot:6241334-Pyramimonas_sp.AAC.1
MRSWTSLTENRQENYDGFGKFVEMENIPLFPIKKQLTDANFSKCVKNYVKQSFQELMVFYLAPAFDEYHPFHRHCGQLFADGIVETGRTTISSNTCLRLP